jgi:tetratricopeptide (TPR) repeat protein
MRLPMAAASALLLLSSSSPLIAQREQAPRRPKIAAADTNDAHAYYDFAVDLIARDPDKAADALYWATRLEPMWADAFYARRVALLLTDRRRLVRYWSGERQVVQSDDIRRIDSLFYYALTLKPFVSQRLDHELFDAVLNEITQGYERQGYGSAGEIRYALDRRLSQAPAADRAWYAYGEGRFGDALVLYAKAIHDDKRNGPLRVDRARVFMQMNSPDSALAELTLAIDDLRKRDKKDLIYVYQSKALTEHSIAIIQQRLGNLDASREALGRALQEDLSYFPAHLQLAFLAIDTKDTTTALTEMDLAVQLRSDDAAAHYLYGFTLAAAGKSTDAEAQLRKSIELNPVYAAPHFVLGQLLEKLGRPADAAKEYTVFLATSAKSDMRRQEAESKAASLGKASSYDNRDDQ